MDVDVDVDMCTEMDAKTGVGLSKAGLMFRPGPWLGLRYTL